MIQGICGRTYIESSVPPATQDSQFLFSWESRLRERLGTIGSTESALIWRGKVSPQGQSISRLARSTRHTNGIDSTGSVWRSPTAGEKRGGAYSDPEKALARIASGHTINLEDQMVGLTEAYWPTVTIKGDWNRSDISEKSGDGLITVMKGVESALWVTPSARDWKDSAGMATAGPDGRNRIDQLPRQMVASAATDPGGLTENGSSATTAKRGAPNPAFPCWLMGWSDELQSGVLRGILSYRSSRRKSSKRSSKPREH
jgi:hypothetical protein